MKLSPNLSQVLLTSSQDVTQRVCVVTPRRRLARQIQDEFYNEIKSASVYNPSIMTIGDWIAKESSPLLLQSNKLLINSVQTSILWEEALGRLSNRDITQVDVFSREGKTLKQDLVAQAQDAWRKIHLFLIEKKKQNFSQDRIASFFYEWSNAYSNICVERNLCDEFMLAELLKGAIIRKELQPAASLWVGFVNVYPAYEKIYDRIRKQSPDKIARMDKAFVMDESTTPSEQWDGNIILREYENEKDELSSLTQAVKQAHLENKNNLIGVVIPGMENNWHEIRQVFLNAFADEIQSSPTSRAESMDRPDLPFDMSWGEELSDYPLIGDMLRLLQLNKHRMPPASFIDLFSTPYISGSEQEADARAGINSKLCKLNETSTSISVEELTKVRNLTSIKAHTSAALFLNTPLLQKRLGRYFAVKGAFDDRASPHKWASVFSEQLEALGWGDIEWSRMERQLWDKWLDITDELYRAGNVVDKMTRGEALDFVVKSCTRIFQPSPPRTKIRILGMQESEGLQFDKLFACHMNSSCLPQPRTNFFIPFELAKVAGLVGGDSYIEYQHAMIDNLCSAAPEVYLSFATLADDEDKLCHPMLEHLPCKQIPMVWQELEPAKLSYERLEDYIAPEVEEQERLRQIVGIIKSHSSCPFQSFMAHRVNPNKVDEPLEELSSLERGVIFHNTMRHFWDEVRSQSKLRAMDEKEEKKLVASCVGNALRDSRSVFLKADEMMLALEKKLLTELAIKLLEFEKSREQEFEVVELEKESKFVIGEREFSLKIDRIDNIKSLPGDSNNVLIDYKLGNKLYTEKDMLGARPAEPQLLIYSMLPRLVNDLCSLGFISINYKQQHKEAGLYIEKEGLFGCGRKSKGQINRTELEDRHKAVRAVYDSFIKGNSQVERRNSSSCNYCDFAAVCRIQELTSAEAISGGDATDV